ncbi:thioesterase-like superfamily-domain-containing protein [Biscogniauxia marginata]|nr:thioesterase-like superfamily-domain-containing protein [Biscogniauxia marginata]
MAPTFAEATAVEAKDSHTYHVNFHPEWCIGSVPHGGVVTSALLRVAALHFRTTLASQNQPHTMTVHVEFVRRTQTGPATVAVRDVKLGRQTSTIHVTLTQNGREEVVAYITNANLDTESGVSLETGWSLQPPPPPRPADFARLGAEGSNEHWAELKNRPFSKFRAAMNHVRMFLPRGGRTRPNLVEEWVRLESGERFTNESIGFVSDAWPQLLEGFEGEKKKKKDEEGGQKSWQWYPTLVLNLDVKKALPPEGVEWLFVRLEAKQVRNGRQDYEIVILDETGEIVALSHHVAMVLSGEKNLAKRRTGKSKI